MAVQAVKTPFTKMSWTPDVPSSALGANEYNSGQNIETNVRAVNSVAGDEYILSVVPGNPIFVTSGYDLANNFWFIVATAQGKWYAIDNSGITNITPSTGNFSGYSVNTVITASWNGNVVFLNDETNSPMYYAVGQQSVWPTIRLYDASYASQTPNTYTWNYDVGYDGSGNVVPLYSSLTAGFVRVYNSPNVGSLLVAGNLTGQINANVVPGGGTTQNLPTTVRWSQNFGLNSGPETWAPTLVNIANELEVPVRGEVVDGFALNGNFYVCSYWDTVLFSPIAYTSTSAPVFGISKVTDGRGLLNENCWAIVDNMAYGIDARDIWAFDGGKFTPIGDQRVKDWFHNNLNNTYTNQVFMINNTRKYQIEIYFPDLNSLGQCNQMISYRYDLDCWNPPRQVSFATMACESPLWTGNVYNPANRGVVYSSYENTSGSGNVQLVQKDIGTSFLGNTAISSVFQRNNISFGQDYSASIQVHRVYPEVYGTGNITVTVGGADSVASTPTYQVSQTMPIVTNNPWVQISQNESRITSVQISGNSNVNTWQMTAANWQITKVQDTR
jgi:hypothetical protein